MPEVTVLIPAYNAESFIEDALRSALAQSLAPREVLVVDDGSTDDTQRRARAFGESVRVITIPHGGPSRARNEGLRQARGTHIVFLDADDILEPELCERATSLLEQHPHLGFVFSNYRLFFEDGQTTGPRIPAGAFGGEAEVILTDPPRQIFSHGHAISSSGLCARREALAEAGYFDESLRGGEDLEYWSRIFLRRSVAFLAHPYVRLRRHPHSATANPMLMIPNIAMSMKRIHVSLEALGLMSEAPVLRRYIRQCLETAIVSLLEAGNARQAWQSLVRFRALAFGPRWPLLAAACLVPRRLLLWRRVRRLRKERRHARGGGRSC